MDAVGLALASAFLFGAMTVAIRLALGRYRGHMTEVAKRLKIGRSTLYRKMQEYGLEPRVN